MRVKVNVIKVDRERDVVARLFVFPKPGPFDNTLYSLCQFSVKFY